MDPRQNEEYVIIGESKTQKMRNSPHTHTQTQTHGHAAQQQYTSPMNHPQDIERQKSEQQQAFIKLLKPILSSLMQFLVLETDM